MKWTLSFHAVIVLLVTGCSPLRPAPLRLAPPPEPPRVRSADVDTAQLLTEANRIADRVKTGELTRTAAADQLNAYRLRVIGSNPIDDASFAAYRYVTSERDAGRMTQEEARAHMEIELRECSRHWARLNPKRSVPLFTNFLIKMYGLPSLNY